MKMRQLAFILIHIQHLMAPFERDAYPLVVLRPIHTL